MTIKDLQPTETFTRKDSQGAWRSESSIELGNKHRLKFTTCKRFSGDLATTAMVVRTSPSSTPGIEMETYVVYQDYSQTLKSCRTRVTAKACAEQHNETIAMWLDPVLAKVAEQYARELAPRAPETDLTLEAEA